MKEAELLLSGRADQVEGMKEQFKQQVSSQMKENFVSAGNMSSTEKKATITFVRKVNSDEKKPEFHKINAEDYKPQQRTNSQHTGFGPPITDF